MAAQPTVFLLDEPLSNLDARLRLEARTFLKKLQHADHAGDTAHTGRADHTGDAGHAGHAGDIDGAGRS